MQVYVGARGGDTGALLGRNDRVRDCCVEAAVYLKVVVRQRRLAADGTVGLMNTQEDLGVLLVRWALAFIQVSCGGLPRGKEDLRVSTVPCGAGNGPIPVGVE